MLMRHYNLIWLFFISIGSGFTQSPVPCSSSEYRQFDFWLGEWNVYDTLGNMVGESKIHRIQDSCGIQENWKSKNSTGTSYNYFRRSDSTWHQIYLDNQGTVLELTGNYLNNQMVLESDYFVSNQTEKKHRITWYLNEKNHVMQIWDVVNLNGAIEKELFRGTYIKK